MVDPDTIVSTLGLQPLPVEGGHWAQTWRDANGTAIYYLLRAPAFSALHRLAHPEIFSFHAGAPARMLLLHPDGSVTRPVLGIDLAAGQRPQVPVPAGVWQATETTGTWTLLGTFMTPPYTDACITFADTTLAAEYPSAAPDIRRLTPL
ncbi:cupin domain-containing protein [Kutzneria sp. 744]|uniref:cupin domain-containing protein n=1 Tax=Kutzneria sp. (strain 744) TaxID=345341 RepID=UPI0003EEA846|nr:cupin domain-containing protein [Kutzneria sp. 744]EWM17714.1 hypothetical protein KUTG_08018 [Kutzneria sp. 744]